MEAPAFVSTLNLEPEEPEVFSTDPPPDFEVETQGDSTGGEEDGEEASTPLSPYRADQIQELDGENADQFGHREYADAILGALPAFPSPFTLGLFGPWGTGKSTILGDIGSRLNDEGGDDSAMAVFDAWRYEGDSLRREFIREVGSQLVESGAIDEDEYDLGDELRQFDFAFTKPGKTGWAMDWGALVPALLAGALALGVILATYFGLPRLGASHNTVLDVEKAIIGSLAAFVLVVANRVVTPVQIQETRQRLEFPDQFAASFRKLLESVKVGRLVIGIDNLDRCSPQRVTQILSTVKGFLEPALQESEDGLRSLCFVIAADDEALRRHLAVEEASRVPVRQGEEEEARLAVEEAVDEYLRKFFNASVRITDALDEDMRGFTARELHNFLLNNELFETPTGDKLVEMAAQALKRNPRRVKQFVNGLTLRLQVFKDRRKSKRIQIEPDILVIAKLAILEEEFRPHFKELREDHTLLAKWHALAAEMEGNQGGLPKRMVGFLRFTDDILTTHIAAYLTQKQTVHELALPGYAEFTESLEEGTAPEEMLDAATPEDLGNYQAAAKDYFDRAVTDHAWSTAHNTTRAVLATPRLQGDEGELAAHVLDEAISQTELKERLSQLDPNQVLDSARRLLQAPRFRLLLDALLGTARDGDVESYRESLSAALAAIIDLLDELAKARIAAAFAEDGLRGDFAAYLQLVEAWPGVAGTRAIREALDQIDGNMLTGQEPSFRFAALALAGPAADQDVLARFLAICRQSLATSRDSGAAEYGQLAQALNEVIPRLNSTPGALELATDLSNSWDALDEDRRWITLNLGLALCEASEEVDQQLGCAFGQQACSLAEKPRLAQWVVANQAQFPGHFRAGIKGRIASEISDHNDLEMATAGTTLAEAFPGDEGQELISAALVQAIANDHLSVAEALLNRLNPSYQEQVVEAAATRLEAVAETADQHEALIKFIVERQERLAVDVVERIATGLVKMVVDRRETSETVGPLIGAIRVAGAAKRHELVKALLDLESEVTDIGRKGAVLRVAALLAGSRPSNARKAVISRIAEHEKSDDSAEVEMAKGVRQYL